MHSDLRFSGRQNPQLEVVLDGQPVALPAGRRSLAAIRSYLETVALEQQRFLCSFHVDGKPVNVSDALENGRRFSKIEGKTIDLAQVPLQIIGTARNQIARIRQRVASAVTLVLINDSRAGREHWWDLARDLKQPLLTLSLMPSSSCSLPSGSASLMQLRKWQLQQLAAIIRDVDDSCWSTNPASLSDSLERRILPWLDGLRATLDLWHETLAAGHEQRVGAVAASQAFPRPKAA